MIHHHIWAPQFGWLTPSVVEYATLTKGPKLGGWKGVQYDGQSSSNAVSATDALTMNALARADGSHPTSALRKAISTVHIRSGADIDGIALGFTDGSYTPWHGGYGG